MSNSKRKMHENDGNNRHMVMEVFSKEQGLGKSHVHDKEQ